MWRWIFIFFACCLLIAFLILGVIAWGLVAIGKLLFLLLGMAMLLLVAIRPYHLKRMENRRPRRMGQRTPPSRMAPNAESNHG